MSFIIQAVGVMRARAAALGLGFVFGVVLACSRMTSPNVVRALLFERHTFSCSELDDGATRPPPRRRRPDIWAWMGSSRPLPRTYRDPGGSGIV